MTRSPLVSPPSSYLSTVILYCCYRRVNTRSLSPSSSLTDEANADLIAIRRTRHLIVGGHVGLASQALNSTSTMADCTDPTVQQFLISLHPPRKSSTALPSLPPETPLVVLEDDHLIARVLRRCDNSSTSGPSGWSGSMVRVLSTSTRHRVALIRLLQDIINDNIPASVQQHLLACRLVAINKPGGGVRPIAVGVFYRVAAAIAVNRVLPEARALTNTEWVALMAADASSTVYSTK